MTIAIDVDIPEGEFYYLAGPMTGHKQHNFPEFKRVAGILSENGYTICSPADLDQPIHDEVMAGDGDQEHLRSDSPLGFELLRRDVNIVMHPGCVGVICLSGWEDSRGAQIETFIADRFDRPLFLFSDDAEGGNVSLIRFDREEALTAHRAIKLLAHMEQAPPLTPRPSAVLELDPLGTSRAMRTLPGLDIPRGRRGV